MKGRWDAARRSGVHLVNINAVVIVTVASSVLPMSRLFGGSGCSTALLGVRVHVQLYGELQAVVNLREQVSEDRRGSNSQAGQGWWRIGAFERPRYVLDSSLIN